MRQEAAGAILCGGCFANGWGQPHARRLTDESVFLQLLVEKSPIKPIAAYPFRIGNRPRQSRCTQLINVQRTYSVLPVHNMLTASQRMAHSSVMMTAGMLLGEEGLKKINVSSEQAPSLPRPDRSC